MPNGRPPAPSRAAAGNAPSAGTGSPSGGVPGTVRPPPRLDAGPARHLLADLVPFLPSPRHLEQPAHQVLVSVKRALRLGDGRPATGRLSMSVRAGLPPTTRSACWPVFTAIIRAAAIARTYPTRLPRSTGAVGRVTAIARTVSDSAAAIDRRGWPRNCHSSHLSDSAAAIDRRGWPRNCS